MKALDILAGSAAPELGESNSFDFSRLGLPRSITSIPQPAPPAQVALADTAVKTKYDHVAHDICPSCKQKMVTALLGTEEVFFCPKHAISFPKPL